MALKKISFDPDAFVTGEDVRDALIGLDDVERGVIITRPGVGEHPVIALNGAPAPAGPKVTLEVEYDDGT